MANFWSKDVTFHFQGYDPGTHTTRLAITLAVAQLDKTVFTNAAERVQAGARQDSIEWAGLYDDATGSGGTALTGASTLLGTGTQYASVYFGTGAVGLVAYGGRVAYLAEKEMGNIGELVRMEATWRMDGTWDRGRIFLYKTGFAGSSISGSYDNGSVTTPANRSAWVQQHSGTGTYVLEDSDAGTTFVQIGTDMVVGAGPLGSVFAMGSGTLRRYSRVRVTAGSTGTVSIIVTQL